MNSHNKPAQKAIHANNQPLEVAFHSAPGLSKSLQAVGFEMDVAQLSRGRLKGSLQLGGSRQLPVLSIQTNQDLLLQGNRRPGVLPLSLNTTDQLPVVRGKETQRCSLHGFHAGLSDAFVQLPAGAHIQVALVSQTRFEQLATATGDHQTLEVIHRSNSANLHPQRFAEISSLIQAQLMGGGQEDLVAWGFKNTGQAITLNDLSATIFASRSSIVHHCRQSFGTGPMALLKQIRLSQVHHALSSPEVQQTIGGSTVHEIACHYGFQSRNHFARDYRNQFGESPSATLQRASAPGMSVQSVSVAQSPQMAMALR